MDRIITVSGKAQHGKDTFANLLKEIVEEHGKRAVILRFADYLKLILKEYFGWDGKKDDNYRKLIQKVGDHVRDREQDFFVDIIINFIKVFWYDYDYFIISDARFENEILNIIDEFGESAVVVTKVFRKNFDNNLIPEQKEHKSETELDSFDFDVLLIIEEGKARETAREFYNFYLL